MTRARSRGALVTATGDHVGGRQQVTWLVNNADSRETITKQPTTVSSSEEQQRKRERETVIMP